LSAECTPSSTTKPKNGFEVVFKYFKSIIKFVTGGVMDKWTKKDLAKVQKEVYGSWFAHLRKGKKGLLDSQNLYILNKNFNAVLHSMIKFRKARTGQIAEDTGVDKKTVLKHLKTLEANGVVKSHGKNGPSRFYEIVMKSSCVMEKPRFLKGGKKVFVNILEETKIK